MSEEVEVVVPDVKMEEGTQPDENDIPRSRLNKVIDERNTLRDQLKNFELQEEGAKKAELEKGEKWQELNAALQQEVDSYKPFKDKFDVLDGKIRADALGKLSEAKQEKFKNLDTPDLLNVVNEFTVKENLPNDIGVVSPKISKKAMSEMDLKDKRSNWGSILDSYKR